MDSVKLLAAILLLVVVMVAVNAVLATPVAGAQSVGKPNLKVVAGGA